MTAELIPYSGKGLHRLSKKYIGKTYGKITISEIVGIKSKHIMVKVRCECGKTKIVDINDIKRRHTKSCGCLANGPNPNKRRFRYGDTYALRQPEHKAWMHIKYMAQYYEYPICDRWTNKNKGYFNFLEDMGRKPNSKCKLTKIIFRKGYSKENCYWYNPEVHKGIKKRWSDE